MSTPHNNDNDDQKENNKLELRRLKVFVRHVEHTILESKKGLTPNEIQDMVQFNIYRKQLLEQLTHLLVSNHMVLGKLFKLVPQYMGMYAMFVDREDTCYVTGDNCTRGRFVVLCEKLQSTTTAPNSFSFFIRNDVYKYVRFFYFVTHFNFYVTRLVVDTTTDALWGDNTILLDLHRKYQCATRTLMHLVIPLESI